MNVDFQPDSHTFSLNNAYLLAHASDLAYKDKKAARSGMRKLGFRRFRSIEDKKSDTQALVAGNDKVVVLAFRGTEGRLQDWITDVRLLKVGGPFRGEVHEGFADALGTVWLGVKQALEDYQDEGQGLWLTGHSLGGGLATLGAAKLIEQAIPVRGLYTFGSPRVGDSVFADAMNVRFRQSYRFVNNNDLVTRIPRRLAGFRHVDTVCYFNSDGELEHGTAAWDRFLDRFRTKLEGFKVIEDHGLADRYIPLLEQQLALTQGDPSAADEA